MKCAHGLTGKRLINGKRCPKDHVPRCRRYCSFGDKQSQGCKYGEKCKFYHPKLCRNSVAKQVCLNLECTYVHLKYTRRYESGQQQPDRDRRDRPPNRDHRANREGDVHREVRLPPNQPATKLNSRFQSNNSSIYTAPYAPTIDNRGQRKARNDSQCEGEPKDSSAFLEKLLENMKNGILLQMENKLLELRNDIPSMIQDSQDATMSRPQSQPPPFISHLQYSQHQPPFPTLPGINMMYQTNKHMAMQQPQMTMQQPQTIPMPNNCQSSYY
jgi:hypothetical protein